jgi:hypothetical protein
MALGCILEDDQRQWDENIPKIVWAIDSAKHKVTSYLPFFVAHGKEIKTHASEYRTTAKPDMDNQVTNRTK